MIPYKQIRDTLSGWSKHPDCVKVLRAPLITPGFPGTFNMSYTEHHWLQEYGSFTDWDHDFVISTVQSCVRLNDLEQITGKNGWRYLGVFEMADLNGEISLKKKPDYAQAMEWQMRELVRFFKDLDIPADRIYASYCAGGQVRDITRGKYGFPYEVPPDLITKNALVQAGVPKKNLLPDRSRDTFLALHIHRPTPWGYRTEIFVDVSSNGSPRLLDVATSEYLLLKPNFRGDQKTHDQICGLTESENGYWGISFGVERLCQAVNGFDRIHEMDYLRDFYGHLRSLMGRTLQERDYFVGESLRVLHRVYTDRDYHPEASVRSEFPGQRDMGFRRRKKAALLKRNIPSCLTPENLRSLLRVHALSQPWHDHLEAAAETTVKEIEEYRHSRAGRMVPCR